MILCHKNGDFTYDIYLHGQTYGFTQEGIEVEDEIAEEILGLYNFILKKDDQGGEI